MANIPLAEIPNAPQSGNPTMQNVNIPAVNLGFAERQIKEAYQGQMIDMKAAAAPGYALQQVGQDMVNIGSLTTDTMRNYAKSEDAIATNQFLNNVTDIRNEIKMAQANADPAMYPVIVKKAYEDKERLMAGIGKFGRQFVAADALRAEHTDMAEAGIAAHLAAKKQETARAMYSMQSSMQSGRFEDAATINDNLLTTQQISDREWASNKLNIENTQQTARLMDVVNTDPEAAEKMVNNALVSGKPIPGFESISTPEMLGRMTRVIDSAKSFQMAERTEAVRTLIDTNAILTVDALNANPVYMRLDAETQKSLRDRILNMKVGTPEAEIATQKGSDIVAGYPRSEDSVREYTDAVRWITANVPEPFASSQLKKLDGKRDDMAGNAGRLPVGQDLERYTTARLNAYEDGGILGEIPDPKTKGTPEYTAAMLKIVRRKEDIKTAISNANPKTQADVDAAIASVVTPDEAKKLATDAKPGWWNTLFPGPARPGGYSKPLPPESKDADAPLPPLVPPQSNAGGFKPALATSFGTNVDGTRDNMDPHPGKYLGEKTHDPNFMAASLSEKALAEEGIPVEQAGQYDVIVRNEKTGKEVRVPIGDLGPTSEVEERNKMRTVDFTGAVHRAIGTKGKDKVVYRVVPRALQEG